MMGCFFGKKPTPELDLLLRALDTDDVMELAGMYGEARDRFKSPELMAAINKELAKAIARRCSHERQGVLIIPA